MTRQIEFERYCLRLERGAVNQNGAIQIEQGERVPVAETALIPDAIATSFWNASAKI